MLLLNDILNLPQTDIDRAKIKFNQYDGDSDPLEEFKRDPEIVNTSWLFWHKNRHYFRVGQLAICLLKLSYDTWLFTVIKEVTKDLGVSDGINYEGYEVERYKSLFGRVIVKYHKTSQTQGRWFGEVMNELEVLQILPSVFDGEDFPGYDKVRLTYKQLKTIIDRQKRDWIGALENQKAVYLITDLSNGKNYVGSATGENGMLLQRWTAYAENGHGGNKELKEIVDCYGIDYVRKNFQYSILENYNARVDKNIILARESWWKETLCTRVFGYNKN